MAKNYAEQISDAQVMCAGLKNNATEVGVRGWASENTATLAAVRAEVVALNDAQEKLKADLKMKTAAFNAKLKDLETLMREARKVVKLSIPQQQWKEFGIAAKH